MRVNGVRAAFVCVGVGTILAGASAGLASVGRSGRDAILPNRGIGAVRIGQPLRIVRHELGMGRGSGSDVSYRLGRIAITVSFDDHWRADAVQTMSAATVIYGHRLAEPYPRVVRLLRHHGWTVGTCGSAQFADLGGTGRATGVIWEGHHFNRAAVTNNGPINPCAASSPGHFVSPPATNHG